MKYLLIGNGPSNLTTLPAVDRVVRFNSATTLPGPCDILCIACSKANADKQCPFTPKTAKEWIAAINFTKEIWTTFPDPSQNYLKELTNLIAPKPLPLVTKEFPRPVTHNYSSGNQVLRYLLEQNDDVLITGFTFRGWKGHPWQIEKEWTLSKIREGKVVQL